MIQTRPAIVFMPITGLKFNPKTQYVQPKLEQHQWSTVTGYSIPVGSRVDPSNMDRLNDAVNDGGS
jgi:hypothetical protein